jgi:uncharacterized protein
MINRTIAILVVCGVLGAAAGPAAQQPDPAVMKDIHRLLDLTGALKVGQQIASMASAQMIEGLRQRGNAIPARAAEIVNQLLDEEFKTAFVPGGDLADGIARVYAKHFTPEEIRGLIAFYETPLGRKVTGTLPAITQDSMQAGMAWAQKAMPAVQKRIEQRLRAEGVIK